VRGETAQVAPAAMPAGARGGRRQPGSVRAVSVHAWFSEDDQSVEPGSSITLPLTVHNLGESTESYTIVPAGLAAGWMTVSNGNLTLFGGSQEVVEVRVAPPALPTTSAGATAIAIRIIPVSDADDTVVAEATVDVSPYDDCRIVPLQPVQRARHRATYEFMVENHGNSVASCRLHLIDSTGRVDGDFDPPAVGVAPGASSLVRLRARAQRGVFRRSSRTLGFEIEATRPHFDPVSTPLSLVQSPTIPGPALARIAGAAVALAAVVAAWLGVVRPAIDDAANDRVDERIAEFERDDPDGSTPVVPAPTTSTPTGPPAGGAPLGEPTFFRLEIDAALTQAASETLTVPDGGVFDMSDVRIENTFNDRGVATLLVNDQQIFVWSLANVRGSAFEPNLTPIRLQPGDNLAFSVRCDEIGDATQSTCTTAVNIGGTTIDAADLAAG